MRRLIVFLLTVFVFMSPAFPGTGSYERKELLLDNEGPCIYLSFEHSKTKDGWTPVVLSLGELDCFLWMDADGKILELLEPGAQHSEPLCVIDVSTHRLQKDGSTLYFDVNEQNSTRTRWRLSPAGPEGTVIKKILFREKRGIDLCLGTLRLQFKHVSWDTQEVSSSPGLLRMKFHGPAVSANHCLVYEKDKGIVYSTLEWNHKLLRGKRQTFTKKSTVTVPNAISAQERAALIALYKSTSGDKWRRKSGWKTPPLAEDGFAMPGTENTWYGITCDPGGTSVESIALFDNKLKGTLPPELGNLTNLYGLRLEMNQLTGSIPAELGNLANLLELSLSMNQLSGSIPPELGNLANLLYLPLSANQLSGSIPPELGNLANLLYLRLDENQLSGSIPPELGNLANLQYLNLINNQLSGSIPPELGNLANLQDLSLYVNQLSGSIPPELGNLVNLQHLGLFMNQLSGSIPPELGNMANLNYLLLVSNQLSGRIPPELGNLANLLILDFSQNQLSGSIPPELGNLASLHEFYLTYNQLSGHIPSELGNLATLQRLYLNFNQLRGRIPSELGNLANLDTLHLEMNLLTGNIPPELSNMANLRNLRLNSNQLKGSIPMELGNMANLEYLELSSNRLRGSIPPELGNLTNLQSLLLNSNRFSGSIPSILTNLKSLINIDFRWNALYTNDDILKAFLDSKQQEGDWESTQTIAPSDVTAVAVSTSSVAVNWTPIAYTADTGGYMVYCSRFHCGPYTFVGMTADKNATSLTVTGLHPGVIYYFTVKTRTNPHEYNQNRVVSESSTKVAVLIPPSPLILTAPNGGESWTFGTVQNITWTALGLHGNLRIELWKGHRKFCIIAHTIPTNNGSYAWTVGNNNVILLPEGDDYKVKIITEYGLYKDASDGSFSIVKL